MRAIPAPAAASDVGITPVAGGGVPGGTPPGSRTAEQVPPSGGIHPAHARHPSLARRAGTWAGIMAAYFTAQTLTQVLGVAAGILFVRYMPVNEFALYTLATSVITFFAFATDLGSTASLLHFFNRAQREQDDFGHYVSAVVALRRGVYLLGAAAVIAAFPVSAIAKGFPTLDVGLATAAVLLAVALQIGTSVRLLVLRLRGHYRQSYVAETAGAALRLVLAGALVGAALLQSWLALLTAALSLALTSRLARDPEVPVAALGAHRPAGLELSERHSHGVAPGLEPGQAASFDLRPHKRAILRYLLPTLPSALYFAVQGPLVVWLAASFGDSSNIAQVGALGRLGLIIGIFSGLSSVVFLPRLARIVEESTWRVRALQFGSVLLAIAGALVALAWLAPQPLLWVLGENYAELDRELLLVVASAGASLLSGYTVSLCMSRGWTRLQPLLTTLHIASQVALVLTLDLSSTAGVLTMSLATSLVGIALQVGLILFELRRVRVA